MRWLQPTQGEIEMNIEMNIGGLPDRSRDQMGLDVEPDGSRGQLEGWGGQMGGGHMGPDRGQGDQTGTWAPYLVPHSPSGTLSPI